MFLDNNRYAHSLPCCLVEEWQPLDAHLQNVASQASCFAQSIESEAWGWNAGLLHDLGKASDAFQAYLRRENSIEDPEYDGIGKGRINHSSAGGALAEDWFSGQGKPFGRILAYLIAGHHAGLPDYFPCDGGRGALEHRLPEGKVHLQSLESTIRQMEPHKKPLLRLPGFVKANNLHFWMRMLFSCLTDADFLDTEAFMDPDRAEKRQGSTDLNVLKSKFNQHMNDLSAHSDKTPVNTIREKILQNCRNAATQTPGLFSLTVPTGGGKTLASMAFALDHAALYGKKRIIYVIPYTSIIEQTASTYSRIFGAEHIVEHHSNIAEEKQTPQNQMASENWDASIVVTTNVQFFESLYASRTSRCRKLHNLVNSVIILDEAQMLPPTLLTPCVAALNELAANYGATIVLATATQPALPNLHNITEIVPDVAALYNQMHRTTITLPESLNEKRTWEDLAEELAKFDQVLCIVNTRRHCYDLFSLMPEGTIHLSALMCGEHRSQVIAQIKERLKAGEPVRVISTQLVEAGVDIDFPVVYRALAGLDSIAQAAGRCNREGKLKENGVVHVFVPPTCAPPGLLRKGEGVTRELHSLPGFDPQSPDAYQQYFKLLYAGVNEMGDKYCERLTPNDSQILPIEFRSVAAEFHLIDPRGQHPVIVRFGKSPNLIEKVRYQGPTRQTMRALQRFTVNIRDTLLGKLIQDGQVEEIHPNIFAQCDMSIYEDTIGLDIFGDPLPFIEV